MTKDNEDEALDWLDEELDELEEADPPGGRARLSPASPHYS